MLPLLIIAINGWNRIQVDFRLSGRRAPGGLMMSSQGATTPFDARPKVDGRPKRSIRRGTGANAERLPLGKRTRCDDHSGAEAVIFGAPTDKAGMPVALQTFRNATSHAQAAGFCVDTCYAS